MQRSRTRSCWAGSLLALLAGVPSQAADTRPSLCSRTELAIFSCAVGGKIVSLCGSPDLAAKTGTLTYRFGRKDAIELSYPAPGVDPRTVFSAAVAGRGDYVTLTRGAFTYTLYSIVGGQDRAEEDGLVVRKDGRTVSRSRCRDFALGDRAWALMYRAGLPKDDGRWADGQ